jgi:Ser/Thr protein kinase RdoA (MazF antagonist)
LSGSALLMPNPVGILPRHGIVLTEWIDGERLSQVIARSDEPTAIAAVSGAAEWIARLHGALPGEWKLLHTDQLLGDLARRVERLRQPDPLIAQAVEVLRNLSGRLADKPTRWAPVHGDFKPANLLDSPLGIVALDVEFQESGPVQADLAQFLNHLQLGGSFPPTAGWSSRALALNRTFVQAYVAAAGRKMPPEALSWLQLAGALRLLARYSHRWTELRSAVSILRTRKLIRRIIQECHD